MAHLHLASRDEAPKPTRTRYQVNQLVWSMTHKRSFRIASINTVVANPIYYGRGLDEDTRLRNGLIDRVLKILYESDLRPYHLVNPRGTFEVVGGTDTRSQGESWANDSLYNHHMAKDALNRALDLVQGTTSYIGDAA